jgi:hypothetical protein
VQTLPDGTWLVNLRLANPACRRAGEHLQVRMIEYQLTDPALPNSAKPYRPVTTLLHPGAYLTLDVVETFLRR